MSAKKRIRAAIETIEQRRYFAGGAPDATFSDDGYASLAPANLFANASKIDGQGRVVVVGVDKTTKGFAIARYTVGGVLDTSFAGKGYLTKDFASTAGVSYGAQDVVIQHDGKIVVVGSGNDGKVAYVARFNANGSSDNAFGHGGVNWYPSNSAGNTFNAVTLQSDGKIVAAGTIAGNYGVARFNTDGSPDTTFDGDGFASFNLGATDELSAVAIDNSGRILLAGTKSVSLYDNTAGLIRLTAAGKLDTTFDGDGNLIVSYNNTRQTRIAGLVVQGDGKIVLAGTQNNADPLLLRVLDNGAFDGSYGVGGWVVKDLGGAETVRGITASYDGGMVIGGVIQTTVSNGTTVKSFLAKFKTDGTFATTFGSNGYVTNLNGSLFNLAPGGGHRFVAATGTGMGTERLMDEGTNLVNMATFNRQATEGGSSTAFVVTRSERLPYATQVFLNYTGTANPPIYNKATGDADFTADGLTFPAAPAADQRPYVVIAANQTFTTVNFVAIDDHVAEATETANFEVAFDPDNYSIGAPYQAKMFINDNDAVTTTKTLRAVGDTYVYSGAPSANYGNATDLLTKNGFDNQVRVGYLKFDLSTIKGVNSAKLLLYGNLHTSADPSLLVEIHGGVNPNWSETGMTYDTFFTSGEAISNRIISGTTAQWYEFDLTDYLRGYTGSSGLVSFSVMSPNPSNSAFTYKSDESATNKPQLQIVTPV